MEKEDWLLPGISFDAWDRRQRTLPNGGMILTREEALAKYAGITEMPPRGVRFARPDEYAPKSDLGQPQTCRVHGTTTWWRKPGDIELICDRCHPSPFDGSNWATAPE